MRAIPGWNGVPFRERVHARRDARLLAFKHHEFDPQTPEAFVTRAMRGCQAGEFTRRTFATF